MFSDFTEQHTIPNQCQLTEVFDWMPVCAIVCDAYGLIQQINAMCVQFFKAQTREDFIFDKQHLTNHVLDQARLKELLRNADKGTEAIQGKIFFRRFDKSISCTEASICKIPDKRDLLLILFFEKPPHTEVYIKELTRAFHNESQRLKPYLNKPGRDLLEEISGTDFSYQIHSKKTSAKCHSNLVGEDRLARISARFPDFSDKELNLCGYLSLQLSIDEIAGLTGNTPNAIRVLFHRICKKIQIESTKDFHKLLNEITN